MDISKITKAARKALKLRYTGAVIVARLQDGLGGADIFLAVGVTALVSGLTIGGKAVGKNIAINSSTKVVFAVGKMLHFFHCFSKRK